MKAMRIAVRPFGVLGEARADAGARKVAAAPAPGLPVVDALCARAARAAGPRGARGASKALYEWLGIAGDADLPAPVRAALLRDPPPRAKLHYYGPRAVIHVAAPDFRGRACSRDEALGELTAAYGAVRAARASRAARARTRADARR